MRPQTPYAAALGDRDPATAMPETLARFESLTAAWTPADFERRVAPGKWSARQILVHLAQTEMALGTRARMAVSTPNYVAQPFEQDAWMAREAGLDGRHAAAALVAIARMNLAWFASLTASDRAVAFAHPEYGSLTVDWIFHQVAGHQIHHLRQLEQIGIGPGSYQ